MLFMSFALSLICLFVIFLFLLFVEHLVTVSVLERCSINKPDLVSC